MRKFTLNQIIKPLSVGIRVLFFSLVLFSGSFISAQTAPITSAATIINATAGTLQTLPVTVTGFSNIGQFTLTMVFDTTKVRYESATTNSSLSGMTVSYTSPSGNTQGKLILSWTGSYNLSLADGSALANLSFTYVTSTGILNWVYTYGSVCQYKTYSGGTLTLLNDSPKNLFYLKGGISNRGAPVILAPTIQNPTTGSIAIPLIVNNFNSIAAITVYLEYDTTVISYQNTFVKNPAFNASFLVGKVAGSGNKKMIVIQWYGSAKTLPGGSTLCTLNFTYLSGITALKWFDNGPSCEYADGSATILIDMPYSDYYINGSVGSENKIKGQLSYNNALNSPLNGVLLQLKDTLDNIIDTTTTSTFTDNSVPGSPLIIEGYYEFNNNPATGNYKVIPVADIAWSSVNATDALLIKRHTVGLASLSGLSLTAADLNKTYTINSTDALLIQLRYIGILTQFVINDWLYDDTLVNVNGLTLHNIKATIAGDVNQSFIPNSTKTATYNKLQRDGIVFTAQHEEIELAFRVTDNIKVGAMTLDLIYNKDLIEIKELNTTLKGLNYKIIEGKIRIVWSDVNAVTLTTDDTLFTLKLSVINNIKPTTNIFSFGKQTEFADENAKIIDFINLKVNAIDTEIQDDNINIYPNPFNDYINILYHLTESGYVSIVFYDSYGKQLNVMENTFKTAGNNIFNSNTKELPSGIYICKINFLGKTIKFNKLIKIIKN